MSANLGAPVPMRKERVGRMQFAFSVILVCAASVLPYISTLTQYFVTDDFGLVQLFSGMPDWHFLTLFTQSYAQGIWGFTTDELRPFPALLYQLGALGGAASPVLQHVINIVLHALVAFLAFAVARTVARASLVASLFAAALFCVLPVHAETVGWITGRVDSILTVFFVLSFAGYVAWRRTGARAHLAWSVAAYVVALYSKQSAITLPAALLLYDWLVVGRKPALSRAGWRPYFPYLALTAAMLALRYALFGNFVREDSFIFPDLAVQYLIMQTHYIQILLIGEAPLTSGQLLLVPAAAAVLALIVARSGTQRLVLSAAANALASERIRIALFFLPAWWLVTTGALIAAGYSTGRFLYLPAFGVAVGLGSVLHALLESANPRARFLAASGAIALFAIALNALLPKIEEINMEASVSGAILRDVQKEAAALPPGALLVIEEKSRPWGYAIPFALQPPFTKFDLTEKYSVVCLQMTYFHPQAWFADTLAALDRWRAHPDSPPVVVLRWDSETGRHASRTDAQAPELRTLARGLAESASARELAARLEALLSRVPL